MPITENTLAAEALRLSPDIEPGSLYYGDCLEVMRAWRPEQADLVYLDPPFNSNQDYNVLYGHDAAAGRTAQRRAFSDTWIWDEAAERRLTEMVNLGRLNPLRKLAEGLRVLLPESGMLAYVTYMAERLVECHRILKPSGSVYLHCDDHAVHYLKIAMDIIFGGPNYLNDVIWRRSPAHNDARRFGRICDHLLFYAKDADKRYWDGRNPDAGRPKSLAEIAQSYPNDDKDGRGPYRPDNLTGPAHGANPGGDSAKPWKTYDVVARGRVWSPPLKGAYAKWIEDNYIPGYRDIKLVHRRLDALETAGLIHHPKRGFWPGLKRYAAADPGAVVPQSLILSPTGFTNYSKGSEWVGLLRKSHSAY